MSVLYLLLPIALGFALAALAVFRWAVRDGQFDDLDTPPLRVLLDSPADREGDA
jgi:cbb3-type cytochrome oxidase maturation protein